MAMESAATEAPSENLIDASPELNQPVSAKEVSQVCRTSDPARTGPVIGVHTPHIPNTVAGTPDYAPTDTHSINLHTADDMHGGVVDAVCV
eukprot:CAMPEP_0114319916 /NCGR_PEP_ID=MMETSP0059-20121206/25579_1 /TAXON_ID=36894 /ORGANISM="Pyramimonas parkeae, Strain CCMP726" /LENGTH=90 /DNA_ID=CAMNT_0001447121 /DNA_START=131 /DNA_END=403 /DNA_ORIENTATION=+